MTVSISSLATQYDAASTEAKWQEFWESQQVFKADPEHPGEPFCVVIPPPNVTGSLHMGHAFENALIDTLVRYHRMQGRNTLWLPGTDHASIAVQTILERQLKAEGKTRQELGREEFLERAWLWKAESGGTIVNQLRRLGVSVDWSRERFTMDQGLSEAVVTAFCQLHKEGLIYRGNYLVNWCPASQSAVSDLEVENKEVAGNLWHFRYPLSNGGGYLEVATTRPETMLGDTAVAVHPEDSRYQHLIGQTVRLPIVGREIPIIGDEFVDREFGTGCVKVTPAHDFNDFEMGQRHNLPFINIMNRDGTLNENAGDFQGQDRFVARRNVLQRLESSGVLVQTEEYKHTVPYSDRGKVPVEPLLSTQWFVKIRPLADKTLELLDQAHSPAFVPQRWTKVYRDWLVSLKDWCISRQLWWGHQIPAWYVVSETNGEITDHTPYIVAATTELAREEAIAKYGEQIHLEQDPDVLDTWFSSGLWPFSTMGWPAETKDLATYYPTSTLVTGFDIIFFWVARMTMMGTYFTGKMPFDTVYIHGLVRDENNKKMSKSANNGIDPLILIKKYGTDALRFTLIKEVAGAGQDIRLEYNRKTDESVSVEASRNFTNKIWNASRFVMISLEGKTPTQLGLPEMDKLELSDRWILSRYHQTIQFTAHQINNYGFGEAAKGLYEFIWGDFCDWYIELVKSRLQPDAAPTSRLVAQQVLAHVLDGILKLLHPFMPHITEELWHNLTQAGDKSLSLERYPPIDPQLINTDLETEFSLLIDTIRTIRNLRADGDVKPGIKVPVILQSESSRECAILRRGLVYIQDLAKVSSVEIREISDIGDLLETPEIVATPDSQEVLEIPKVREISPASQNLLPTQPPKSNPPASASSASWAMARSSKSQNWLLLSALPLFVILFVGIISLLGLGAIYQLFLKIINKQPLTKANISPIPQTQTKISSVPPLITPALITPPLISPQPTPPITLPLSQQSLTGVVGTIQVLIPLDGVVDLVALRSKLEKSLQKAQAEIEALSRRLSNPGFVDKARPDVVAAARTALLEAEKQAAILSDRLSSLPPIS